MLVLSPKTELPPKQIMLVGQNIKSGDKINLLHSLIQHKCISSTVSDSFCSDLWVVKLLCATSPIQAFCFLILHSSFPETWIMRLLAERWKCSLRHNMRGRAFCKLSDEYSIRDRGNNSLELLLTQQIKPKSFGQIQIRSLPLFDFHWSPKSLLLCNLPLCSHFPAFERCFYRAQQL